MNTLILYASKHGFTKDCVNELKELLTGNTCLVNAKSDKIPSTEDFDNIIIGGSVHMGQIQKELKDYCLKYKDILAAKKLFLFLSCGLPENFNEALKYAYPEELLKKSISTECFGGELRIEKMGLAERMLTRMMKKASQKEGKPEPSKNVEGIRRLADAVNLQ
jgi:menaquinone-dependent protoporphyrinogen oxidase